jgi:hypothetical protein
MLKKIALMIALTTLFLAGCASAAPTRSASNMEMQNGAAEAPAASEPSYKSSVDNYAGAPGEGAQSQEPVRLVIQNANLTIVVDDPGQAMVVVRNMAQEMGGFVVTSNLYKTYVNESEVPEANITVRVPADRLNDAMETIKSLVEDRLRDVKVENVSGQDVTKEYTDLNSRLKNLEETEVQLREIMASAVKTEDVLAVYRELTGIREQIEVIQGQVQYYEEAAALSSIAVVLRAQAAVQPLEIGGWQPVGVARDATQALINAMQFLANAAIWMILFLLPVGLVIFLPLRLLWVLLRRGRKPKVQPPSGPPTTPQAA